MHASQFAQALELQQQHGWARFVTMQDHYNLIYREEEREMLPLCHREGVAVIPWSPLARGKLTRPWGETTARLVSDEVMEKLYTGTEENDAAIAERLAGMAEDKGATRAQVALAWLLGKRGGCGADYWHIARRAAGRAAGSGRCEAEAGTGTDCRAGNAVPTASGGGI